MRLLFWKVHLFCMMVTEEKHSFWCNCKSRPIVGVKKKIIWCHLDGSETSGLSHTAVFWHFITHYCQFKKKANTYTGGSQQGITWRRSGHTQKAKKLAAVELKVCVCVCFQKIIGTRTCPKINTVHKIWDSLVIYFWWRCRFVKLCPQRTLGQAWSSESKQEGVKLWKL